MLPTQITTLLMATNILHSYYKHNDIMFITWMGLYTSSLIYHFTKTHIPIDLRTTRLIYYIDIFFCICVYLGVYYNFSIVKIPQPYSTFIYTLHTVCPLIYIPAAKYKILMWDTDMYTSEVWHSIFHLVVYSETHLFLLISPGDYSKPETNSIY